MRITLLTLRYSSAIGGFDDGPLREFAREREVLAFREHFFVVDGIPHLTCVLTWRMLEAPAARAEPSDRIETHAPRPRRTRDPLANLDPAQRRCFEDLRVWRAETARAEGVPAFVLFTNRQLAEIVERRPDSATALGHVHGIGPKKIERHGAALLARLGVAPDRGTA